MANLYSSVKATCANYNRLVRIEEGHIPTPSYQRAEEIGVELIDLPPPEPNIQESAKQKFASSPSNNKTKRRKININLRKLFRTRGSTVGLFVQFNGEGIKRKCTVQIK